MGVWEFSAQPNPPARYTDRRPLVPEGRPFGEIELQDIFPPEV